MNSFMSNNSNNDNTLNLITSAATNSNTNTNNLSSSSLTTNTPTNFMSSISDNNNISKENSSRKRTRATPEQLAILEKTFIINPSPNNRVREQLSHQLNMSERSIQIWFQNRRAKVKNVAKRNSMLHDEMLRMQYYASTAAAAACQAVVFYQQQKNGHLNEMTEDPVKSNPDLYYYYYYYYFNEQQHQQQRYNRQHYYTTYHPYYYPNAMSNSNDNSTLFEQQHHTKPIDVTTTTSATPVTVTAPTTVSSFPPPLSLKSMPLPPPPPPPPSSTNAPLSGSTSPHCIWSKKQMQQQRARAHTIGPYFPSNNNHYYYQLQQQQEQPATPETAATATYYYRGVSVELSTLDNNSIQPVVTSPTTTTPISASASVASSSLPLQLQENYTTILNDISHTAADVLHQQQQPLSSSSTPSPTLQQQQQLDHLSINTTTHLDLPPFHSQSTPPSFFDQNSQLTWPNLPFYEDPTIMMTPTTPSLFNPTTHNLQQQPHYYTMLTNNNKQQQPIQRISAEVLQIGTWKRMAFTPHDLLCQYDKENKLFSWCIQDGLSKFKMEFSETMIESIKFAPLPTRPGWARLEMHILSAQSISFYMKQENGWVQCRDFTEDRQASSALLHQLDGPALALKAELDLLTKDNPSLLITQ